MHPLHVAVVLILSAGPVAQSPEFTSWIIDPGTETGYGRKLTNTRSNRYAPGDIHVLCTSIPG